MSSGTRGRGYTIVELMMSIGVLAIGVSGVIAMEKVTVATNRNAKEIATATRVAEAWADELTADAATWTTDSSGASTRPSTIWLSAAVANGTVDWFTPAYSAALSFGPAFGPQGNPVDPAGGHVYCTQLRLAFIHDENTPTVGNGMIRAQIRVFWLREDYVDSVPANVVNAPCSAQPADLTTYSTAFNFIYLTTAVRQLPLSIR